MQIVEEGMREGMQIESAEISIESKIRLLEGLSRTGIQTIVAGSFVSPTWTPQMAQVDEVIRGFAPMPGVTYTALALNPRGRERMREFIPPLSESNEFPRTLVHLCDVFVRRNTNRSQGAEIAEWQSIVQRALDEGAVTAGVAINAAWGSNWLGSFDQDYRMDMLARQVELWNQAGIGVDRVWIGDPMAWNVPDQVALQISAIVDRWPEIETFHLHLHDARGTALLSAYEALKALDERHTLVMDTSIGGMGGCPYGGHGQMTRMIPTEDLVDLLNELGIPTGIDLDALIEVALLAEETVGHRLWGHLSRVGPRPRDGRLYAMDMPFIETESEAQHFRSGPSVYSHARSPWKEPIESPYREVAERGGNVGAAVRAALDAG